MGGPLVRGGGAGQTPPPAAREGPLTLGLLSLALVTSGRPCPLLLSPPLPSRRRSQDELSDGKIARPRGKAGKSLAPSPTPHPCFRRGLGGGGNGNPQQGGEESQRQARLWSSALYWPRSTAHTSVPLLMPPCAPPRPRASAPRSSSSSFSTGREDLREDARFVSVPWHRPASFQSSPPGPGPGPLGQEVWLWSFPKCSLGSSHRPAAGKPQGPGGHPRAPRITGMGPCRSEVCASVSSPSHGENVCSRLWWGCGVTGGSSVPRWTVSE